MVKHIQYLLVSHSNMNKLLTHILYLKAQKPPIIKKDLSTSTPWKKETDATHFPTVFSQFVFK